MRLAAMLAVCGSLFLAGCGGDADEATGVDPANDPALAGRGAPGSGNGEDGPSQTDSNVAGLRVVPLSPEDTTIQFVGTHVTDDGGPDPRARTGVFTEFSGQAGIDAGSDTLKSVSVEIQTSSLQTPIDRLNGHLVSPDFFNVREYPTARFESTEISTKLGGSSTHTIVGDLTILETTKRISFPATVRVSDGDVSLDATFVLDRTEFGLNYDPNQVNTEVTMTVAIGKKTGPAQTAGGVGGGDGRGRGGRGFDPAAMFGRIDADGDGKLVGDEIPDWMQENLATIDADGNNEVTLEEFQQNRPRFGGRRGLGGQQE